MPPSRVRPFLLILVIASVFGTIPATSGAQSGRKAVRVEEAQVRTVQSGRVSARGWAKFEVVRLVWRQRTESNVLGINDGVGAPVDDGTVIMTLDATGPEQLAEIQAACVDLAATGIAAYRKQLGAADTADVTYSRSTSGTVDVGFSVKSILATAQIRHQSQETRTVSPYERAKRKTESEMATMTYALEAVNCAQLGNDAAKALSQLDIRAGSSGFIDSIAVKAGSKVAYLTELAAIANPRHVEVVVQVDHAAYNTVYVNDRCHITWDSEEGTWPGAVSRKLGVGGDPRAFQVACRAFTAPRRPFRSMTANVIIDVGEAGLTVPVDALVHSSGDPGVFVAREDGTVAFTRVDIGARDSAYVRITAGVVPGERVVRDGFAGLEDGDSVEIWPWIADHITAQSDRDVMGRLARALGVAAWLDDLGRALEAPLYTWPGVWATPEECVVHIDLRGRGLFGSLTSEVGTLPCLKSIDLGDNDLRGVVPVEIGALVGLEALLVDGNEGLGGPMPQEVTALRLRELRTLGSEVCIPVDKGFEAWVETVVDHQGTSSCEVPPVVQPRPLERKTYQVSVPMPVPTHQGRTAHHYGLIKGHMQAHIMPTPGFRFVDVQVNSAGTTRSKHAGDAWIVVNEHVVLVHAQVFPERCKRQGKRGWTNEPKSGELYEFCHGFYPTSVSLNVVEEEIPLDYGGRSADVNSNWQPWQPLRASKVIPNISGRGRFPCPAGRSGCMVFRRRPR